MRNFISMFVSNEFYENKKISLSKKKFSSANVCLNYFNQHLLEELFI